MPGYKIIEIYTSEEARWRRRPVHSALIDYVNSLNISARALVTRGIEGSYEDGAIAADRLVIPTGKMPIRTTIILKAGSFHAVMSKVQDMVTEGIVTASDIEVLVHRIGGAGSEGVIGDVR